MEANAGEAEVFKAAMIFPGPSRGPGEGNALLQNSWLTSLVTTPLSKPHTEPGRIARASFRVQEHRQERGLHPITRPVHPNGACTPQMRPVCPTEARFHGVTHPSTLHPSVSPGPVARAPWSRGPHILPLWIWPVGGSSPKVVLPAPPSSFPPLVRPFKSRSPEPSSGQPRCHGDQAPLTEGRARVRRRRTEPPRRSGTAELGAAGARPDAAGAGPRRLPSPRRSRGHGATRPAPRPAPRLPGRGRRAERRGRRQPRPET